MKRAVCALALSLVCAFAAPAFAYSGAANDPDNPTNNATVSLNGNSCTGTLIAPNLVLTAGHCGTVTPPADRRDHDGSFFPTQQWALLASPFTVRIGPDPNTSDASRTYTATWVTQAGWADLQVILLDRDVPASQAIPVRPLTRLTPAQSTADFWTTQTFTAAGFGGGRPIRQTASFTDGRFPCRTLRHLIANREFLCPFQRNGANIEPGDSGGPLYWTDPATRRRFVIGVTQGGAQMMRECTGTNGDPARSACGISRDPALVQDTASGCWRQTGENAAFPGWNPQHYTTTFFRGGQCWTDLAGQTRHEPDIGAWLDSVLLWQPSTHDALIPIVLQQTTGPHPRYEIRQFDGSDVDRTILRARLINAHAPLLFPSSNLGSYFYRWRTDGADAGVFTSSFQGFTFERHTWGDGEIYSPSLIGRLWRDPAPGLARLIIYMHDVTHESLTTWDLERTIPDPAERAHWSVTSYLGYVQLVAEPLGPVHVEPIRPGPRLPPIRRQR